ncbi:MAG: YbhB/YbcL family Raf kinase inhibitor-like protein [Candidatus Babeliales bacterium]|nr:YbhB/YbcL family Raf kinase inhibitor-like protein [Candidatus Babeliales bacterium]
MKLESSAFKNNEAIPAKYSADGENVSPQLSWNGQPNKTHSFVLIVDDPDAPSAKTPKGAPWVHWVVFNIPANVHKLDTAAVVEALEAKEGVNGNHEKKYFGPKPPAGSGTHHYNFRIYALDVMLELHAGATKDQVQEAMKHHIIAHGELIGTYE